MLRETIEMKLLMYKQLRDINGCKKYYNLIPILIEKLKKNKERKKTIK